MSNVFVKIVKNSFYILVSLILISIYSDRALSVDYTETFDSSINNSGLWSSQRGVLDFQSDSGRDFAIFKLPIGQTPFPYLKTNNLYLIKPDYESVSLSIKFSNNTVNQGAGYIFSDNVPDISNSLNFSGLMFYIWPKPNGNFYLFSSICPSENQSCNIALQLSEGVFSMPTDSLWHTLTISRIASHYEWKLDNNLIFTTVDTSRLISSVGIGNPENTSGYQIWPELNIDFLGIDTLPPFVSPSPSPSLAPSPTPTPSPSLSPTPTATATPTPTPSITPTPTATAAAYPYYSQNDPKWASQMYDHAAEWASWGKRGIDRWGCALTSAAMVLKNYGVKTVTGAVTTPENLNNWLKSQVDGYIGNGLVNWLAISRYTHQSYVRGKSPTELEFVKKYYSSATNDQDIVNGLSPILGLPGHFVVSYALSGSDYLINDPNDILRNLISKTDSIFTTNSFIPSHTNLAYMLFVYDPQMQVEVRDKSGHEVGGIKSEEYLTDDKSGTTSEHLILLYIPKPETGSYTIETSNPQNAKAKIDMYMYDKSGNVTLRKMTIKPETDTSFEIKYNQSKVSKTSVHHNWQWVWRFIKKWSRWERVRDLRDAWEERH